MELIFRHVFREIPCVYRAYPEVWTDDRKISDVEQLADFQ